MTEHLKNLYAKKSKKNINYIIKLWDEITLKLSCEGINEFDRRYYPYITTRLKKKLGIQEKIQIFKRFKDFLLETQKGK